MIVRILFGLVFIFSTESCLALSPVSIVNMIASPEKYVGHNVRVYGYYGEGSGTKLYLTREYADAGITESAITFASDSESMEKIYKCRNNYVFVEGEVTRLSDGAIIIARVTEVYTTYDQIQCLRSEREKDKPYSSLFEYKNKQGEK